MDAEAAPVPAGATKQAPGDAGNGNEETEDGDAGNGNEETEEWLPEQLRRLLRGGSMTPAADQYRIIPEQFAYFLSGFSCYL